MKKKLLYTLLGLMGIMGALSMGVVSATEPKDWVEGTNFYTITVYDPSDTSKGLTIMDRNLGATVASTECSNSNTGACGYNYQWGNNYGFPLTNDVSINAKNALTDGPTYVQTTMEHKGYYGTTFIKPHDGMDWDDEDPYYWSDTHYDYWKNGKPYPKLWGGENDRNYEHNKGPSGIYWDDGNNRDYRRGPCPYGYHVPSAGEWSKLLEYWAAYYTNNGGNIDIQYSLSNEAIISPSTSFIEYFKLPYPASRSIAATLSYNTSFYWSSTPYPTSDNPGQWDTNYCMGLNIKGTNGRVHMGQKYAGEAFAVRCFKDSYSYVAPTTITCEAGKYLPANTSACASCPAGKYCVGGTYSINASSDQGIGGSCNANTYSAGGASAATCTACPSGYTSTAGSTAKNSCTISCPANYRVNTADAQCTTACGVGYEHASHTVSAGSTSTACTAKSITCEAGKYLRASDATCKSCPEGKYCEGGKWTYNGNDHGIAICPTDYTSDAGATSANECYKVITATFKPNGNKLDGGDYDVPKNCNLYYNSSTCNITTPTITANAKTSEIVGYTTSSSGVSTASTGSASSLDISGGEIYYAHSKKGKVTLTAEWNDNNSTLSSTEDKTCDLVEVYDGADQETSCTVDAPTITPNENTPNIIGFNISSSNTTNNDAYNTTTKKLTLTVSNDNNTRYAITKSDAKTYSVIYTKGTGVSAIGETSSGCNIAETYNGTAQSPNCTISAPTITLEAGYGTGIWSTGDITRNPGETITLTGDDTYTASATPNTDTQYLVRYYQENLNGGYDLHETWTGHGTTDTQAVVTGTDKSYDGFIFSGTHASNITSGNIDGDGSRELKLYYDRMEYTVTFDSNSGSTVDPITVKYQSGITLPEPTRTGYTFKGWGDAFLSGSYTVTGDITLTGQWIAETYVVTYNVNGGDTVSLNTGSITYELPYGTLPTATRNGYSFNGWFTATTSGNQITSSTIVSSTGDHTLYAHWTQNPASGGSSSGGGGRGGSTSAIDVVKESMDSSMNNSTDSKETAVDGNEGTVDSSNSETSEPKYSEEFQNAYTFAREKSITTMNTIEEADMEGGLTRIAMAKMLSYYAINVLGKKPDTARKIKFRDISSKLDGQYDNGVTLAYQLGIMGINMPKNRFRPNDYVTRAEFGTALSRMLFGIADGKDVYYSTHLAELKKRKIITNDNPNLQELRGYVMIMLMRSAENK